MGSSSVWRAVSSTAVLYGSLALFTSVLHNVFLLYYVETFVSVYKIDKVSFWVGEVSVVASDQVVEAVAVVTCVCVCSIDCVPDLEQPERPSVWLAE